MRNEDIRRRSRNRASWATRGWVTDGDGETQTGPAGAAVGGVVVYEALNGIMEEAGFDGFVEQLCERFYAERMGRLSLPPPVYFRLQLIGYFEGIDLERGIAWRLADSLALREFLGYGLQRSTPDHSTISRNRPLMDLESHREVFVWVLRVLTKEGFLEGKTLGVDSTTLEANAALRSRSRRLLNPVALRFAGSNNLLPAPIQ